jgi:hypothetical protein
MSTKSKKTKQKSINQLINTLLETNLYHPQLVENTNRELNTRIYQHLRKNKNDTNRHTYEKIKVVTDQLAILAHAAMVQSVIVRTMSNKQFKKIQDELLRLKNNLRHTK